METSPVAGIDLWWIPLGAGGQFVRLNGRVVEALAALRQRRAPLELYHSALEVRVPDGRFVIENAWPIPPGRPEARGVVVEGPVFDSRLARLRALRYEVRRWRDGRIPDARWAVESPQRLSHDLGAAQRLLALVPAVPAHVWGRRVPGTQEMWNSNSVVAWLLARAGLVMERIRPPTGGTAPGWHAGVRLATPGNATGSFGPAD